MLITSLVQCSLGNLPVEYLITNRKTIKQHLKTKTLNLIHGQFYQDRAKALGSSYKVRQIDDNACG